MIQKRPFKLVDCLLLLLVLAAAGGARFYYLTQRADWGNAEAAALIRVQQSTVSSDGDELDLLVANIRTHGVLPGFRTIPPLGENEEPTAQVAPGYPIVRALVEQGAQDYAADYTKPAAAMRWLQALLGTLTAGLYFALARRAFDNSLVALLAGLFTALDPFAVINTAELRDGTLASFVLACALFLGVRCGQQGGALSSLAYGVTLAATALVRASMLPFAIVGLLWFLWRSRSLPGGWMSAAVAFLGFIGGLAPWTVRNHREFDEPVPMVTTAWYQLWVGNNPQATGGDARAQAELALSPERRATLSQRPQGKRYNELASDTWNEVSANPTGTVERRLFAGLYYLASPGVVHRSGIAAAPSGAAPTPADAVLSDDLLRLTLYGTLFGMLVLGVLGWRWSHSWRHSSMPLQLACIWLPLPYILSYSSDLHGARLPLDGVLLTLAAFALATLLPGSGLKSQPDVAVRDEPAPARM